MPNYLQEVNCYGQDYEWIKIWMVRYEWFTNGVKSRGQQNKKAWSVIEKKSRNHEIANLIAVIEI